ncbi:Lymphatic vessel endothelial hyaluronic acid receptor 1 [Triplophysa tibetana]|uniref:Lymphatic vessel endothelial hyaluronic acid receptor 1 n=1 Tax=Triplophysa tibetana TaxID=1572043 RepID=A0A5A9P0A4_9TELE|nr:Lymphatic vessel endothelial hyaluronic acid receptor 1 [Triplophysa tibetana]KAA0715338.1 Lymphatic vessel endothelial hyaluronic acid receptor 1 [Triplophysa tibetana]
MAGVWLTLCPLFTLCICTLCVDVNQIQVPKDDGISGVVLVQTKDKKYSFNATTAKEACNAIKMRIATKAEMETANKHGLQTCRYGWIEEQVAVVPRIDRNPKCGKNSTGISVWRADIRNLFDVYCIKPQGPDGHFETSTRLESTTERRRKPSTTHSSTISIQTSTTHSTSSPVTSLPPYSSTPSISSGFNTSSNTSTVILSSISKITSQATTSPRLHSSPRTLTEVLTLPILSSSLSFTNTVVQHTSPLTGQTDLSQTAGPYKPSIRAVPKAVVIVSVMLLLLLAAVGTAWYLKIKRGQQFPSWTRIREKYFSETEMCQHIIDRHCMQEQTSKDNNNRKCDNIILRMEQDPDTD